MAAETSTRNAFLLTLVNACFENNCSDESVAQMTGISDYVFKLPHPDPKLEILIGSAKLLRSSMLWCELSEVDWETLQKFLQEYGKAGSSQQTVGLAIIYIQKNLMPLRQAIKDDNREKQEEILALFKKTPPGCHDWGDVEQTLSSAWANCYGGSILSALSLAVDHNETSEISEFLEGDQYYSASKAKDWFKATIPKIINPFKRGPTAQSASAASSVSSSPLSRTPGDPTFVSPQSHFDDEDSDSDSSRPRKRQKKCDAWTHEEMAALTKYYVEGACISRGLTTAKKIKRSDDNHPSCPKTLERFSSEQIAEKLKAMSKANKL